LNQGPDCLSRIEFDKEETVDDDEGFLNCLQDNDLFQNVNQNPKQKNRKWERITFVDETDKCLVNDVTNAELHATDDNQANAKTDLIALSVEHFGGNINISKR
jgi:hypothetical protein